MAEIDLVKFPSDECHWNFLIKFKFKFMIWYIALGYPSDVASILARTTYGEVKKIHSTWWFKTQER